MKGFYDELRFWLKESWQELKGQTDGEIIRRLREQFGLTELPDQTTIRRWIGRLRAKDVEEEEATQNAEAPPAASLNQFASLKEFLGDIPSMAWNINELRNWGIPKREANNVLDVYDALLEHQRMGLLGELENNKYFLLLCFRVKLRQIYPFLPSDELKRYLRILAHGTDYEPIMDLIHRRLARHSISRNNRMGILQRLKKVAEGLGAKVPPGLQLERN